MCRWKSAFDFDGCWVAGVGRYGDSLALWRVFFLKSRPQHWENPHRMDGANLAFFFREMVAMLPCWEDPTAATLEELLSDFVLTWNLKIQPWKRRNIYKPPIFGFHVSFWGCSWKLEMSNIWSFKWPSENCKPRDGSAFTNLQFLLSQVKGTLISQVTKSLSTWGLPFNPGSR